MHTREIPQLEWQDFFDHFSRQHERWRTTVAILGRDVTGLGLEARQMPLGGITMDVKDGKRALAIMLGDKASEHLTHTVADPKHVRLRETEEGAHEALIIEAADGTVTIVRFRTTILPEMLDGVLP